MSCEWDCGSCGNSDCCQPHPYPGCDTDWVTECVCGMAPNCCAYGWDPKCADVAVNMCGFPCEVPCEPSCYTSWGGYKECGDDGCGGVCGWCAKGQECTDDGQCVGGGGLKCADLVNCGLECGFSLECYGECYTQGSPAAKPLFQELTFCVLQACGVNPMPECAKMSLDGECAEQYEKCLMN
jgi:hypothetical protein